MSTFESTLAPLTAVDAVNAMLLSIGQGGIHSIESSESVDGENAKTILKNTSRKVQGRGWWFNRERDYSLLPDVNGTILLPESVLKFDPDPQWRHVVERGRQLYDTKNHTFVFAQGVTIKATLTFFLRFEDTPEVARSYIAARAGREFQIGRIASQLLYQFTREMETEAFTEMNRAHLKGERPNLFTDNYQAHRIARLRRQ